MASKLTIARTRQGSTRQRKASRSQRVSKQPAASRRWHHRLTGFVKAKPLVFIGIFAVIGLVIAGLSQAATSTPNGTIANANGKCLYNYSQRTSDGNPVVLWTCNGTTGEQWSLLDDGTIRVQSKCLDTDGHSKVTGMHVVIYSCNSSWATQKWTVKPDKSIVNTASGLCLNNRNSSKDNGNSINIGPCRSASAQQWSVPSGVAATAPISTSTPTPLATTPTPALTPPAPSVSSSAKYPANVLGLGQWKLNIPVAGGNGYSKEISQPDLAAYSDGKFFMLNADRNGVLFRTYYGGVTTSGSHNPRTELREMTGSNGQSAASWSTTSGTHVMTVRGKVNRLTKVRPETVIAQIHDASDDVTVFHLTGTTLYATNGNSTNWNIVDSNFNLGVEHTWGFKVSGGKVSYTYDGKTLPFTLSTKATGCYFKAGNYLQSNPSDGRSSKESTSEYSEVEISDLQVSHN